MNKEATLGNLLSQTFTEIGDNPRLILIYLVMSVPIQALALFYDSGQPTWGIDATAMIAAAGEGAAAAIVIIGTLIAGIALNYWLYAGLVRQTLSPGFNRILPFIGVYILGFLGIVLGLVLLIIPGLILLTRWMVVLAVVVGRDEPAMQSFGTSMEMTRGKAWSIFGALVIVAIGVSIVAGVVGGMFGFMSGSLDIVAKLGIAFAGELQTVVFTAFAIGTYRLLRDDTQEVAEVFA